MDKVRRPPLLRSLILPPLHLVPRARKAPKPSSASQRNDNVVLFAPIIVGARNALANGSANAIACGSLKFIVLQLHCKLLVYSNRNVLKFERRAMSGLLQ